ncbi:hypothetical protein RQM59_13910 [Flavobacteriaceae bacterium S356]|uniref:Uncharacterized protein n=1 Tax=Asprobacillus argus TaxID=3076534 RepID=A0ABU3LIQ7_9FLAO|nr:hypothetical protein [Flavobacteriaceae bacterium S356]
MKTNILKWYLLSIFSLSTLYSCVDNLDFDQIEYSASPVYNSPIISFDLNQSNFIDPTTNTDVTTVSDITDFTYLDNSFVRDNLQRVALNFEVNNQFDNRTFSFSIEFLDANNNPTHPIINFTAQPNQLLVPPIETILIANNQDFLRTRKIRVSVEMSTSTTPLSPTVIQNLSFKSAGTFYVST